MATVTIWFVELPLVSGNDYDKTQSLVGASLALPDMIDETYLRRYLNDVVIED